MSGKTLKSRIISRVHLHGLLVQKMNSILLFVDFLHRPIPLSDTLNT